MSKTVHECVSFVIIDNGCVLLEKRSLLKETDPGLITLPGGHVEPGETVDQALKRELFEELGIEQFKSIYTCTELHESEETQRIHYYRVFDFVGNLLCKEADELHSVAMPCAEYPQIVADRKALTKFADEIAASKL